MLLKTALARKINRMIFKCRLSLTSPAKATTTTTASTGRIAANGGYGYARRSPSAVRADNAYLLAVFFVLFLFVMIVTQVMVMRSEWSATAGRWRERLPQEQSRDAWVDELWLCFRMRAKCPWQPVAGPDKCFVYSAYVDHTGAWSAASTFVRVIGVARTKKPDRLWCQLGYAFPSNGTIRWRSVPAQIKTIREHWNLRYSAAFFLCPLKDVRGEVPDFVSIASEPQPAMPGYGFPRAADRDEFNASYGHWSANPTRNVLLVTRSTSPPLVRELAVCVKPLHYNFNRVGQLVEFIEMHRLLGATHFTFYNHTVGREVDCVLRRYEDEGLVEVLPWRQLDVASQKEIRTEGIFASLNDCLYRHMYDSRYLLMIDLDELIVPRRQRTLIDMIHSTLNATSTDRIGAFYFRNAFFYLSWPDDPEARADEADDAFQLTSLKKTRRNVKLHPHRIRSKYICRPMSVVEVGNHFVWEFRAGFVAAHVPDSLAIMHHYRNCEFGGESCLANPSVQDRSAWRYGDDLKAAVRRRRERYGGVCPALAFRPPSFNSSATSLAPKLVAQP